MQEQGLLLLLAWRLLHMLPQLKQLLPAKLGNYATSLTAQMCQVALLVKQQIV